MDESLCSGHNKPYNPNEVQLLIALKSSGMPWRLIELEYNRQVPADRQRTASALENKWRQLLSIQIHVRHKYGILLALSDAAQVPQQ